MNFFEWSNSNEKNESKEDKIIESLGKIHQKLDGEMNDKEMVIRTNDDEWRIYRQNGSVYIDFHFKSLSSRTFQFVNGALSKGGIIEEGPASNADIILNDLSVLERQVYGRLSNSSLEFDDNLEKTKKEIVNNLSNVVEIYKWIRGSSDIKVNGNLWKIYREEGETKIDFYYNDGQRTFQFSNGSIAVGSIYEGNSLMIKKDLQKLKEILQNKTESSRK